MLNNKAQILEGSQAVALTIKNITPQVISAYPITPQTHIVEDLAKFKANGQANYEYVRAESEFAAASIIAGASATGVRVYSATSSQGLLLMTEVVFNIAGLRLPVVMTIANRGVSSPITIWNDHQDAMTIRDAGWIMLFAENHQEAVAQHILAYKVAEKLSLPANVNIDGFVLTHSYEPVIIPSATAIKKYLLNYKPQAGTYLDPQNPMTMGAFARPAYYQDIRQKLHTDLQNSIKTIQNEYKLLQKILGKEVATADNSACTEYYGPKNAKTIIVTMGSVAGTVKQVIDHSKKVALLKIKLYRPFPQAEVVEQLKGAKNIIVLEKAISLGSLGPLATDVKSAAQFKLKANIKNVITGLGGKDITESMIEKIIKQANIKNNQAVFI